MTTPERLRRRQYIEGAGLAFLGLGVVFSSILSGQKDSSQDRADAKRDEAFRACITTQVQGIGTYLDSRSDTTGRKNDAIDTVINTIAEDLAKQRLADIQNALNDYGITSREIKIDRMESKLPPFPNGKCEF